MKKPSAAQTCASIIRGGWINPDCKKMNEKVVRELLREDHQRRQMERAVLERGLYLKYAAKGYGLHPTDKAIQRLSQQYAKQIARRLRRPS